MLWCGPNLAFWIALVPSSSSVLLTILTQLRNCSIKLCPNTRKSRNCILGMEEMELPPWISMTSRCTSFLKDKKYSKIFVLYAHHCHHNFFTIIIRQLKSSCGKSSEKLVGGINSSRICFIIILCIRDWT